ncbi:hypothetical protein PR001_g16032 [Phytophthora rubi]|uniref:Shugoshin C-terminal domain-containing protein n=1 Tax=Phytophthora rubi TaxID=129364 RepID=A0A6A3KZ68_9STRA|nr:hypothetical protein PR001_g16032 [Phytophthora rubi]
MVQGTSTARAFSIMQELQQLRDKVGGISEKNRQLAKALTGASRRLRRRDAGVSYAEPKLNTKLRRGDYYGLGKRTGQQVKSHRHHRPPKHRVISEPRRATFVTSPFGQQRSPFRRHTTRPVQRVSYAEPKLNTKLRQGDKFTFTT